MVCPSVGAPAPDVPWSAEAGDAWEDLFEVEIEVDTLEGRRQCWEPFRTPPYLLKPGERIL